MSSKKIIVPLEVTKVKPNTLNDWLRGKKNIIQNYNLSNSFSSCRKVTTAKHHELVILTNLLI